MQKQLHSLRFCPIWALFLASFKDIHGPVLDDIPDMGIFSPLIWKEYLRCRLHLSVKAN